jgi:hypothetical protein
MLAHKLLFLPIKVNDELARLYHPLNSDANFTDCGAIWQIAPLV